MQDAAVAVYLPIFLFVVCVLVLAAGLLVLPNLVSPRRSTRVKQMPYESGMDPIHDTRRRFDVRFNLLAVAFLVFDVELLFLYPWAVTARPAAVAAADGQRPAAGAAPATADPAGQVRPADQSMQPAIEALRSSAAGRRMLAGNRALVFPGVMVFIALLALGFVYDWRKGVFRWR